MCYFEALDRLRDSKFSMVAVEEKRCIVTIRGKTYDLTSFLSEHPGGSDVLLNVNGQDATEAFEDAGHSSTAKSQMAKYYIGLALLPESPTAIHLSESDKPPLASRPFSITVPVQVWYILSSLLIATIALVAGFSGTQTPAGDIQNAHPKTGELGFGRFVILGYLDYINFSYPFRLPVTTNGALISAWLGYILHQSGQFYILATALKAKAEGTLKWTEGKYNPYASAMLYLNIVFIGLHVIQSHIWYDGLASSVPEVTALGSVVVMLVMVYLVEIPRRGIMFNKFPVDRQKPLIKAFTDFMKKYHGFVASFGIVYDYWYHPLDVTAGHYTGFLYIFLLFWQSSLVYQVEHKNRYWTVFLEAFVCLHGFVTAIFQGGTLWMMFFFGFTWCFVLTQLWGVPVVQSYLTSAQDLATGRKRYWIVLLSSVLSFLAVTLVVYGLLNRITTVYMVLFIPLMMYITGFIYFVGYVVGYYANKFFVEQNTIVRSGSFVWWIVSLIWAVIVNLIAVCSFAIWLRGDLKLPSENVPASFKS